MKRADIKYIENFLDEIEVIYNYDIEGILPAYVEDMIANIRVILLEEEQKLNENIRSNS